jgi:hypothetical protein
MTPQALDALDFGPQPPKLLKLRVHSEVRLRARIVAVWEG